MPRVAVSFLGCPGSASRRVRDVAAERGWDVVTDLTAAEEQAIIIVAVVLPEEGESIDRLDARLENLRSRDIPVLLLAEPELVEEAKLSWRAGTDDFASPHASAAEVGVRLDILVQGAQRRDDETRIHLGDVIFDRARRVLYDERREVRLTARECVLLEALADFSGTVVSREDLAQRVWGYEVSRSRESNVLEVYINYLRKKLALLGAADRLRTVRGVGYALAAGQTDAQPTRN